MIVVRVTIKKQGEEKIFEEKTYLNLCTIVRVPYSFFMRSVLPNNVIGGEFVEKMRSQTEFSSTVACTHIHKRDKYIKIMTRQD